MDQNVIIPLIQLVFLGVHDTIFFNPSTSMDIFICVIADTNYRYQYFYHKNYY